MTTRHQHNNSNKNNNNNDDQNSIFTTISNKTGKYLGVPVRPIISGFGASKQPVDNSLTFTVYPSAKLIVFGYGPWRGLARTVLSPPPMKGECNPLPMTPLRRPRDGRPISAGRFAPRRSQWACVRAGRFPIGRVQPAAADWPRPPGHGRCPQGEYGLRSKQRARHSRELLDTCLAIWLT